MIPEVMTKDPGDVLDYDVDFTRWLPAGDVVTSAVASIADCTAQIQRTDVSENSVKVWISGGADGEDGTVHVLATTDQGRTKDVPFRLRIRSA